QGVWRRAGERKRAAGCRDEGRSPVSAQLRADHQQVLRWQNCRSERRWQLPGRLRRWGQVVQRPAGCRASAECRGGGSGGRRLA
ncbi:unnamed protein product, partial [Symbiodinium sp. CCMP2456]